MASRYYVDSLERGSQHFHLSQKELDSLREHGMSSFAALAIAGPAADWVITVDATIAGLYEAQMRATGLLIRALQYERTP